MSASTLLSASALAGAMAESPEYKALVLKWEKEAAKALTEKFEVKSLGVTMTLVQIAVTYQAYKGIPKSFGANSRKFSESISRECLAILQAKGYKADWASIQALSHHA